MITFHDHGVKCFRVQLDDLQIGLISRYMGIYKLTINTIGIVAPVLTSEDLDVINDKLKGLNS